MDLSPMIFPNVDLHAIRHALEGVGHEGRLRAVGEWGAKEMAALYEAAADADATTLDDFVPSDREAFSEVIHHGKNSLPMFSHFQKRFARPADDAGVTEQLWGYNEQTMRGVTGPGYFIVHPFEKGGVVIDYTMLPPKGLPTWPAIKPNEAGLSRFVYGGMKDVMRKLSANVTIGRAERGGQAMDAWFVLVREDPTP